MSDERPWFDGELGGWLGELWETPVGRRWLLKAGLGSAAAMAAGAWVAPGSARAAKRASAASTRVGLQFALGAAGGLSGLVLVANGQRYPLVAHTEQSRTALRATGGLWARIRLSALTHHVPDVVLPAGQGVVITVYGRQDGRDVVVSQLQHCPADATLALAKLSHRLKGSVKGVVASRPRLASLGLGATALSTPEEAVALSTVLDTYTAAETLVKLHPNVATRNPAALSVTQSVLADSGDVQGLGTYIQTMQKQGRPYATNVDVLDADGAKSQIVIGGQTQTFQMTQLNRDDDTFVRRTRQAVIAGVRGVRDSQDLGAVIDQPLEQDKTASTMTWVQPEGVFPTPTPFSRQLAAGAGIDVKVKNDGFLFGTRTEFKGIDQKGNVSLKLYNNFVRWIWVYVQYLGKNDSNLSADPNAKFPNTKHAQSLGLLPQVFTVLGIPVWDQNSIDVTLNFPEDAHSARLLYCGLGSDLLDGGWRQYFPADAYPGGIAPTDEVVVSALLTAILTIGLNVFALATDLDIAATWISIRKNIVGDLFDMSEAFLAVLNGTIPLTVSEAAAAALAAGAARITDANAKLDNLWSILLGLATVIPKVIFNPRAVKFFFNIAETLVADSAADKLAESLPVAGQVLAVIEAVGDAITLAEVCAETILSPWVIENEVTRTYAATVTIDPDPAHRVFPFTATGWRLEAKVDGALVLDAITGSVKGGSSDPLVVRVVAPFGGAQIQWSVVLTDARGSQVGTGASALLVNDDPASPPTQVHFAITEQPATLTAATVFKRAATTAYSPADQGYVWSDRVTVTATATSEGLQEVLSAAIATRLGIAGAVFKAGDKYWLRGVPVAENGKVIKLGVARQEGYLRRPFLLLDSFVAQADEGNHVLLEPDETTQGYHVRKLTLDPHSGQLTWDPAVSHGEFQLPVDAAGLHSSGKVVVVSTASGRVGRLKPVVIPTAASGPSTPQRAAYTGGPGTQIGLLSSPVALAVTNPGTVLVLEAAGLQLSAFDLNGNPVRYFGENPNDRQYTLALTPGRAYLDVAVDGANQIYLLSHAGDGTHPDDYYLDVHTQTGTPLVTKSSGVNAPHIAVDYFRSIFVANYAPLTDLNTTTPHKNPDLSVTEPSLSRFDPTQPTKLLHFTG